MSIAINSQTQVAFIPEVTFGVTPATPAFQTARITGESLEAVRTQRYSSELNGARGERNAVIAESHGAGGIDFEFTNGSFDTILQSLLRSTWTADVISDANVPTGNSLTIETKFEDGATDIYKRLSGAFADGMMLDMKAGEVVKGNATFLAQQGDYSNAAIAGASYVAGNTESILVGAQVGSMALAGLAFDAVAAFNINIKNNLRTQLALNGSLNPFGIAAGKLEITGQLVLFMDATMYSVLRAGLDGTLTGFTGQFGSAAGKRYRIELPKLLLETPKAASPNADGDVMVTVPYRALQSSTIGNSVIRITRAV